MQEFFTIKEQGEYNLRNQADFVVPHVKSVNFGFESIRYIGPKIWESLPQDSTRTKKQFIVLKLPLRNGSHNNNNNNNNNNNSNNNNNNNLEDWSG